MSTFDDDEASVSQNRPIDLYTIVTPSAGTYRLTSHPVDIVYAANVYTALTAGRGDTEVGQDPTGRELTIMLPISHPLIQRFAATGIPEQTVYVTMLRLQTVSSVAVQFWSGYATGLSVTGQMASLLVPPVTDDALRVKLPVVRAQKLCNHRLYDSLCQIDRNSFKVVTTAVSQAISTVYAGAATLVVASIGGNPNGWAAFGEIYNAVSEGRQILSQTSTTLVINSPFVGMAPGDALTFYAGCGHSLTICKAKFNNVVNFGGHPHMNPAIDPWGLKGLGIIQQP